jgi:hypothetical protein
LTLSSACGARQRHCSASRLLGIDVDFIIVAHRRAQSSSASRFTARDCAGTNAGGRVRLIFMSAASARAPGCSGAACSGRASGAPSRREDRARPGEVIARVDEFDDVLLAGVPSLDFENRRRSASSGSVVSRLRRVSSYADIAVTKRAPSGSRVGTETCDMVGMLARPSGRKTRVFRKPLISDPFRTVCPIFQDHGHCNYNRPRSICVCVLHPGAHFVQCQ